MGENNNDPGWSACGATDSSHSASAKKKKKTSFPTRSKLGAQQSRLLTLATPSGIARFKVHWTGSHKDTARFVATANKDASL